MRPSRVLGRKTFEYEAIGHLTDQPKSAPSIQLVPPEPTMIPLKPHKKPYYIILE